MEKKLTKHEIKRIESDKRILEATIKIVGEKGYTNANFKEIAKEAGITPGLITQRFDTKENLLACAIKHADTIWAPEKLSMDIPLEEMLKNSINRIKQDYKKNKQTFRFTYVVCSGTDIPASIKEMNKEFFYRSSTYKILKKGQDNGYFPKGDLSTLYNIFIVNTCRLVMDYSMPGMTMPDEEYFMKLIQYKDPVAEEHQLYRNSAFESIAHTYINVFYMNVNTGEYRVVKVIEGIEQYVEKYQDAQEFLNEVCNEKVDIKYRETIKEFVDLSTVMERLGDKRLIARDYVGIDKSTYKITFISVLDEPDKKIVLFGVQKLSEIV